MVLWTIFSLDLSLHCHVLQAANDPRALNKYLALYILSSSCFTSPHKYLQGGDQGIPPPNFWNNEKKFLLLPTHNQGLQYLFMTMSWDLRAKRAPPDGILVVLQFRKQHKSRGPLKGAPCQKALNKYLALHILSSSCLTSPCKYFQGGPRHTPA